jgi:hypothetical protein
MATYKHFGGKPCKQGIPELYAVNFAPFLHLLLKALKAGNARK